MSYSLKDWEGGGTRLEFRGHSVFYRRAGKGPFVLAIHGYPLSSWDWNRIWDHLCKDYELAAADMLGFGFSDKPLDYAYSVSDHADMQLALLEKLAVTDFHLLCHDMGNTVAQELLARSEEQPNIPRIRSISFLNGGLFPEVYRPRLIQRLLCSPIGGFIGPRIPRTLFDKSISEVFGAQTKPSAEDLDLFWQLVNRLDGLRVSHLVGRFVLERQVFRDRWVSPMRRTNIPMQFINGPADPNSGAHMVERFRELIPNQRTVMLRGGIGHWPQLEAPKDTARQIGLFLEAVAP